MIVLAVNCGSSSVKFQLVAFDRIDGDQRLARGAIERVGGEAVLTFSREGEAPARRAARADASDSGAAARMAIGWATSAVPVSGDPGGGIRAVGHRLVHGGERFVRPTLIDSDVMAAMEELDSLAPLHNASSLAGVRAARDVLGPKVPMVAVFDTVFHATLPEHATRYALPEALARRHRIRRYGFHGTAYQSVLSRYCALTGTPRDRATLVAFHLGNGCSVAAIRGGRSVDTSMGFTPLEGLVMGTRSGDLDPSIIPYLAHQEKLSPAEVERILNEGSGLLGVSGRSRDMRDLLEHERTDPRARLAVEIFSYRARKYLGAYLAALGGAEAVIFSGGIGENSPAVRGRILEGMAWCGLILDQERNDATLGREGRISAANARIHAFVIPADEELVIAQETARCLKVSGACLG